MKTLKCWPISLKKENEITMNRIITWICQTQRLQNQVSFSKIKFSFVKLCNFHLENAQNLSISTEMINSEQHEVIGWRDPSEFVEDTPKRKSKPDNTPYFSISCSSDEARSKIIKQIIALNGKVCENLMKYDSKCTHFVCEKPSRSEKMLSCVAAGKWVLGLSYIQESYEAKRFLNVSQSNDARFHFHSNKNQTIFNRMKTLLS